MHECIGQPTAYLFRHTSVALKLLRTLLCGFEVLTRALELAPKRIERCGSR